MSTRTGFRRFLLLGVLPLLAAIGCSSEGSISGKVTYQGRTVTGGTIIFTSPEGSSSSSIAEDGTYSIARMKTGPAKIAVETKSAQGAISTAPKAGGDPKKGGGKNVEFPPEAAKSSYAGTPRTTKAEKIPEHYEDPDKSGLTYIVKGGPQEYDVELK